MSKSVFNKFPLRKITIEGDIYLWKRVHYYNSPSSLALRVYLNNHKNSKLELHFKQEDNQQRRNKHNWVINDPDAGVIWRLPDEQNDLGLKCIFINLNRPAVIEIIIRHFILTKQWQPKTVNKPVYIKDALLLLDTELSITQSINEQPCG